MTIEEKVFKQIEKRQESYVKRLKEFVHIAGISASIPHREELFKTADWLESSMKKLKISVNKIDNGEHEMEGKKVKLPPILLGSIGQDPKKLTILVYGHYDVQPAEKGDGWNTEPFELTEKNGKLYGRGSTDDKGPVLAWLCAIEAYQELGLELPVNIKFCFEGMEEYGSEGLDDLIVREADKYFKNVDCVCISDNYWLGKNKPCLTYGLRGISYFVVEIKGPGQDLHSGVFGGTVHEPMIDLAHVISKLVSPSGKILIPGIMDQVRTLTKEEESLYDGLDFNIKDFHGSLGSSNTIFNDEKSILMHRWRYPSLSFHGIEGAFSGSGAKTVIPATVKGKFSIRSVPDMEPDHLTDIVEKHVMAEFGKLKSKNHLKIDCVHAGKAWLSDVNHWNFVAGAKALENVWNVQPDYTREGGSIPVTLTFQNVLKKNVLLLPIGACDDGAHSTNEKIDRKNFIEGIKVLSSYLYQLSIVKRK